MSLVRSRTIRIAAVFGVAVLTVWLAIQQWPGDGASASTSRLGARPGTVSSIDAGNWLRRIPGGRPGVGLVEVRLDTLLEQVALDGSITLSRENVTQMVRGVLGDDVRPIESIRVGELLDEVRRLKLSYGSLSVTLERRELLALLEQAAGDEQQVEQMLIGELLDAYPSLQLSTEQVAAELRGRSLRGVLHEALGQIDRVGRTRDAGFDERLRLRLSYAEVVDTVRNVRLDEGFDPQDTQVVYDEAFARLLEADHLDAVPLLDGHQRFEQEMAKVVLSELSRSEQIRFRQAARRHAFGAELAARLFAREESMERFEVDRIEIESDPGLGDEELVARIRERREALKVEMAGRGTYVGFPDETRSEIQAELRERYGDQFDTMTAEELRAVERAAYLDRLPVEIRERIEGRQP